MTTRADRPTGVILLAVAAVIAGVADVLAGLGDIGIAGGFLSDHGFGDTLNGIMNGVGLALVAVGVLGLATAYVPRGSLSMPPPAPTSGPSGMIASSKTCLLYRMRSPAPSWPFLLLT